MEPNTNQIQIQLQSIAEDFEDSDTENESDDDAAIDDSDDSCHTEETTISEQNSDDIYLRMDSCYVEMDCYCTNCVQKVFLEK